MEFQLVVQFRGTREAADFDSLVALEDLLIERIGSAAEVDGHDMGSGESNIFIVTTDPEATFRLVHAALTERDLMSTARVAYRDVTSDRFTWIWPEGATEEFDVA